MTGVSPGTFVVAKTIKEAEKWVSKKMKPVDEDFVPSWGKIPTKAELNKLAKDYSEIPSDMRKWAEKADRDVTVVVIKEGEGITAKAAGNEVWLYERGLKPDTYKGINQHELRHVMVADEVIRDNGGWNNMWKELTDNKIRKPIHVNSMYEVNGRNVRAGVDELITQLGNEYGEKITKSDFKARIMANTDVESKLYSNEVTYGNMSKWTDEEASKVADLWFKWFRIEE